MSNEEYVFYFENATKEWEEKLRINSNSSIEYHKDSCTANNFSTYNFGLDPKNLPLLNIRYNFRLHMPYAIVYKILH